MTSTSSSLIYHCIPLTYHHCRCVKYTLPCLAPIAPGKAIHRKNLHYKWTRLRHSWSLCSLLTTKGLQNLLHIAQYIHVRSKLLIFQNNRRSMGFTCPTFSKYNSISIGALSTCSTYSVPIFQSKQRILRE